MDNEAKNESILRKRAKEAQRNSMFRRTDHFLDFLDLNEQRIVNGIERESDVKQIFFGGFEMAERKMAGFFYQPFGMEEDEFLSRFPIKIIGIRPANQKFAQKLSHRDFLGAVLNLGMERSQVGDIIVKEKEEYAAYLYVTPFAADLILNELERVKSTSVKCEELKMADEPKFQPSLEEMTVSVSSERIDAVIGHVFHFSRSESSDLIRAEKVFRNSQLVLSADKLLKAGDVVSVRGYGKFRYEGEAYQNKKGKSVVKINKYV